MKSTIIFILSCLLAVILFVFDFIWAEEIKKKKEDKIIFTLLFFISWVVVGFGIYEMLSRF